LKVCRHRRRDDRHRVAAPRLLTGGLPGASLQMSHGVGVLNIADNVCPRVPTTLGDCRKSRIGSLKPSVNN
jgi:hypothetical protein